MKNLSQEINNFFEQEIKPIINQDGGDIEFLDFKDGIVTVKLKGACVGCAISVYTVKLGIENRLQEVFPEIKEVIAV